MQSRKAILFIVTFFVSFCSIVYELIYSQLLTIIFGGAVLRYSLTIGLFLFCLGVGSFLYNYFEKYDKKKLFVYVEIILSIVGFFGVWFIIVINSYFSALPHWMLITLSNLPIVAVGILSGLELPLLSFFTGEKASAYSQILGVDYLGSLAGTVLYSLVFYPFQGPIFSAFIVAFFNLIIALLLFIFLYKKRDTLLILLLVVLFISFTSILFNINTFSDYLMKIYLSQTITESYSRWGLTQLVVNISEIIFTPYQMIYLYSTVLNPHTPYELNNTCLNIDEHVQLCDSWVNEYHSGLVDLPLSFFENVSSDTRVLLVGGGDGIATNFLRKYGVSIDLVDIDGKFVEYGKRSEFVSKYQNNSFDYPLLNLTIGDGFSFVKNTNNKYDLVLLDLPGLKEDKLLPLYSREFFISLNNSLKEKGVIVMWVYSFDNYPDYAKIMINTLAVSGFNYFIPYNSYYLPGGQSKIVEEYIMVSREDSREINLDKNDYVKSLSIFYSNLSWQKIEFSDDIPVNSVFKPSYAMLIKDE